MEYFCLIYPDAVFNGKANKVVEQFARVGIHIEKHVVRKLSWEEASTIFYSRRFNHEFELFCKAMTQTAVWLLHLSYSGHLEESLALYIHEDLIGEFFIPSSLEDNENFLRIVTEAKNAREQLAEIIQQMRERVNLENQRSDLEFTQYAMVQGERLFSYYIAMQINGFQQEQAFALTESMQKAMLTQEAYYEESEDEYEEEEGAEDDDMGIDDEDDGSDA